jgi:lipopolysaccharide/colanic/teichoic acid biosynthesis glycosyltransferase
MTWMVIERSDVKLYKPVYRKVKRSLEIALCLILLPLIAPLFLIIAIAIRLDSPGPVFFIQERVGKGGRRFKMIKFRTMQHNLDTSAHQTFMRAFVRGQVSAENNTVFKPFKKNQVTAIGRILRKTSLDELPQLINVFRGEMCLVGPRPNVPWEVEEYRTIHQERLEVLPGITGLAQVQGRSGITFDEIVKYDIEYVEKQSFTMDLQILWWTFASVLLGKGAE